MKFNFDEIVSREKSGSVKWDLRETKGSSDIIPMWVADMDFKAPPEIIEALVKRAQHGIFGYTFPYDSYKNSIVNWMKKRHDLTINEEWITVTPGVVPALSTAVNAYTKPGDKILIQPPVYHPFKKVIEGNGRVALENRLIYKDNYYFMDFENLEILLKEGVSMFVLCSPHNPVGRVWKHDELNRLAELCLTYDTLIVSDEIHSDLIMPGKKHLPMAMICQNTGNRLITLTAASKTFNLAGLSCSSILIEDPKLRNVFQKTLLKQSITMPNIFGLTAAEAAYNHCEEWLDSLILYINENYLFLEEYIKKNLPEIEVTLLEGTYLAWLDFSGFNISDERIDEILFQKARIWLDNGPQFGTGGKGFQRINLACPRSVLEEALSRLKSAFKTL